MTLLSGGVSIAFKVTKALGMHADVTVQRRVQDGGTGDPTYQSTKYTAIVAYKSRLINEDGRERLSNCNVTFVEQIAVSVGDVIIFSDGTKNTILSVDSPTDKSGRLITQAFL